MMAGGVLVYFEERQVKQFFSSLADNFPSGEIVFGAGSKLGVWIANKFFSLALRCKPLSNGG